MQKYTLNKDYFENIDSHNKAYWLGFIQADGAIDGPRNNQLRIKIQTKDKHLLEQFLKDINYSGPIKSKDNHVKVCITSKKLTEDLSKYGIVKNKTYKTTLLNLNQYTSSYILGLFDGDGCACYYVDKKNRHVLCISLVSNNTTCLQLIEYFKKEVLVDFRVINKVTYSEIQTTKFDNLVKIYDFLYQSNVYCLQRKKDKFNSYFAHIKERRSETIIAVPKGE